MVVTVAMVTVVVPRKAMIVMMVAIVVDVMILVVRAGAARCP
jgi:hypothetical protein